MESFNSPTKDSCWAKCATNSAKCGMATLCCTSKCGGTCLVKTVSCALGSCIPVHTAGLIFKLMACLGKSKSCRNRSAHTTTNDDDNIAKKFGDHLCRNIKTYVLATIGVTYAVYANQEMLYTHLPVESMDFPATVGESMVTYMREAIVVLQETKPINSALTNPAPLQVENYLTMGLNRLMEIGIFNLAMMKQHFVEHHNGLTQAMNGFTSGVGRSMVQNQSRPVYELLKSGVLTVELYDEEYSAHSPFKSLGLKVGKYSSVREAINRIVSERTQKHVFLELYFDKAMKRKNVVKNPKTEVDML